MFTFDRVVKQLTPQELKQLELEKKAREREELKAQKKLVADFKKLWFKPKEDLEVEDLKVRFCVNLKWNYAIASFMDVYQ